MTSQISFVFFFLLLLLFFLLLISSLLLSSSSSSSSSPSYYYYYYWGWSGGAKVLGKLPVLGRPTNLDYSRARAYCTCSRCGWGGLDIFTLICHFSFLSPSLWETARYRLKYCLKGPLSPKQPTNQPNYYYYYYHHHHHIIIIMIYFILFYFFLTFAEALIFNFHMGI